MATPTAIDFPARELEEFSRKHKLTELAIFGSALRDDFRKDSDIDILVDWLPGTPIGLMEFEGMRQELSALLGRPVDLGSKRSLRPEVRDEILGSRRVLYAA